MSFLKKEKGITLIALVVTIVILLILASISIGALMGNNGIVKQAQNAKEQTEIADEKEKIDLSTVGAVGKEPRGELKRNYFNEELTAHIGEEGKDYSLSESEELPFIVEYLDSKRSYLVDGDGNITGPLKAPEETEEPETGGRTFTMENGVIEIKWLAGNTNYAVDTPNAPIIKENLPEGTTMELVKYEEGENGEEGDWVSGTDYNYIAGNGIEDNNSSRWANARVTIDGVDSYFVWIPRYAYRIVYFADEESKKAYMEDNSKTDGIVGYSDSRGIVDKNGKRVDGVTSYKSVNVGEYFMPHPAFTDNLELGGWNKNIEGIWVGKYETGKYNNKLIIQSNIESCRNLDIGEMFDTAKKYNINLNSHMLKNSEWGAVTYLTESKYGRNGTAVTKNANLNYITANGNIVENKKQSSTGNETGIYDLRGGSLEYVAMYYEENDDYEYDYGIGNSLKNEKQNWYVTVYKERNYKVGDATYETKGWHKSRYQIYTYLFLQRGGRNNTGFRASIFDCDCSSGTDANKNSSFRVCLIAE